MIFGISKVHCRCIVISGNQCNSHNTVLSGRFQGHCCWTTNGFWAYSIETDITQIRTNPNFPYWFHHFLWLDHDHMYHLSSVFDSLHSLGHPIIRATHKLVTTCYVWPDVNKDVHQWARSCLKCQKSKVYHHTVTPLSTWCAIISIFLKLANCQNSRKKPNITFFSEILIIYQYLGVMQSSARPTWVYLLRAKSMVSFNASKATSYKLFCCVEFNFSSGLNKVFAKQANLII